jgi:hypothetical protein
LLLNPNRIFLVLLALVFPLAACDVSPLSEKFGLTVSNTSDLAGEVNVLEVCSGGMRVQISFPASGIIVDSGLVSPNSEYSNSFTHGSKKGDSFVLEAWCFAQDGQESGYFKKQGSLSLAPSYVTFVETSCKDPSSYFVCEISEGEKRGTNVPRVTGYLSTHK